MDEVIENRLISRLASGFPRSPLQRNGLQETDAELVSLNGSCPLLAVTTDWIVEEIESGLYTDPYLIGWMTVAVNASDLAAAGAAPLGILVNENLPRALAPTFLDQLQRGIRDACEASGLYVLGGDTNVSDRLELGGTALGLIREGPPLTRLGCAPGDLLFGSGPFGSGGAYAFVQFAGRRREPLAAFPFQPQPRLRQGQALRGIASACMDSSDGLLATLDQLMRLNSVGFVVGPLEDMMDRQALQLSAATGLPAWMALAGPHGEFELVFTLPPERERELHERAAAIEWQPLRLGKVVREPGVWFPAGSEIRPFDTGRIRNLFEECEGNIGKYFAGLLQMASSLKGDES